MHDILRQEWLDSLPDATVETYSKMSREIVEVIIRRIKDIGGLSQTDALRLTNSIQYYGADMKAIERIIAKYTGQSEAEIDSLFRELAHENDEFAIQYYKYRDLTPQAAFGDRFLAEQLQFIIQRTKDDLGRNLSQTMAFKGFDGQYHGIREIYKSYIDRAIYEIQGGTVDYNTAMKQAVRNLSEGIEYVQWDTVIGHDANGNPIYYHRRLDSAVRQNILDGVRQANQAIMDFHGREFGSDGVELTAHALSAPDHAPVQGRQFSNEQFARMQDGLSSVDYDGVYHEGFPRAIGEWNCRHFALPIILGVSERVYSDDQLSQYEKNSAEKYPAKQKQRQMEVALRKMKEEYRMLKTAFMDDEARRLKQKINTKQKALRLFCEENGIEYEPNRARPY